MERFGWLNAVLASYLTDATRSVCWGGLNSGSHLPTTEILTTAPQCWLVRTSHLFNTYTVSKNFKSPHNKHTTKTNTNTIFQQQFCFCCMHVHPQEQHKGCTAPTKLYLTTFNPITQYNSCILISYWRKQKRFYCKNVASPILLVHLFFAVTLLLVELWSFCCFVFHFFIVINKNIQYASCITAAWRTHTVEQL